MKVLWKTIMSACSCQRNGRRTHSVLHNGRIAWVEHSHSKPYESEQQKHKRIPFNWAAGIQFLVCLRATTISKQHEFCRFVDIFRFSSNGIFLHFLRSAEGTKSVISAQTRLHNTQNEPYQPFHVLMTLLTIYAIMR